MQTIEADYVIVGAGSAGCVMAARLSEDPNTKVVLLEAGGPDTNMWIHIPLGFGKTFADRSVNWCFETEPDAGAAGRRIFWPRGKVLGGSSSINGMVYIRGQKEDFDHWRQLGNTGWSYDDCLPYFKRAFHQTRGADDYHSTGGPVTVSDFPPTDPISKAFIESAQEVGLPYNADFNGAVQEGVGYHQTTTRNGKRCSTAVGYLRPAMKRPNLRVITHALSERITFEGTRATGVVVQPERHAADGARGEGSDPVQRRHRLAASADAVGRRPRRGAGRAWDRGGEGPEGRRTEPAGSLLGTNQAAVEVPRHRQ